ncbi:MAG: peptidoglycan DD-metalloendopeptidase family protein [Oscillospiraceae bacterium]|nr:peptidoglycan DD-metalloendopeptidase family protein [Oscillospiraceae bacterium]
MKKRKLWISILAGVMAAVMLLSLILSMIPASVSAASSSEIKQQINELKTQKEDLQSRMEDIQSQYEENEDEIVNIVNEKNKIDQEITLLYEQIDNINAQLSAYALLIADKQDELDNAQERMDELNAKNKERIRAMEEDGSISYWSVLFKAKSFSDLLDRLNMIEEIAASDQRRLQEMSAAAEEVAAAQEELAAEKAELELAKDELDATQEVLDAKQAEAQEMLTELIAHSEELTELFEGFELEEEALMNEIAAKEKEYNEAKRQEWLEYMATYTTVAPATTTPTTSSGGTSNSTGTTDDNSGSSGGTSSGSSTWLVPCSYTMLSSPFGKRESPTAGASSYHQGVDLAAPANTPIYASRTGVVTVATSSKSAGNYVTINHGDGYSSIYMHMTRYVVSKGQAVSAGQLIGYVGSTGISTGNHLHFGISYNGTYVNPANYVNLHP